ncbi:hypothetical protein Csa_005357 [Cucumis sativus]|nr:hypothetical protein Csa_005357 [Cucumis sativus]
MDVISIFSDKAPNESQRIFKGLRLWCEYWIGLLQFHLRLGMTVLRGWIVHDSLPSLIFVRPVKVVARSRIGPNIHCYASLPFPFTHNQHSPSSSSDLHSPSLSLSGSNLLVSNPFCFDLCLVPFLESHRNLP